MMNTIVIPNLTIAGGAVLDQKEPVLLKADQKELTLLKMSTTTNQLPEAALEEQKVSLEPAAAATQFPEIVIYEDINFGGASARTNLNWLYVGDFWNDKISSIIVVSGTWRFYADSYYRGFSKDLGPGYYSWVPNVGISNDSISSFQVIAW